MVGMLFKTLMDAYGVLDGARLIRGLQDIFYL